MKSERRPGITGWLGIGVACVLITVVAAGVVWLSMIGGIGALRYVNVPVLHPFPPPGYYQNPFEANNRDSLISTAEANRVKGDYLRDGDVELQALATNDATRLPEADAGRRLDAMRRIIEKHSAKSVDSTQSNEGQSIVVGHLSDPNEANVTVCVEERGSATIITRSTATGEPVARQHFSYTTRAWMVVTAGHYLVTDVEIHSSAVPQ